MSESKGEGSLEDAADEKPQAKPTGSAESKGSAPEAKGEEKKGEGKEAEEDEWEELEEVEDTVSRIVRELEDFFNGNEALTSKIGDFFAEHAAKLAVTKDITEEQSLELHEVYLAYCELIETGLEEFLSKRNVTTDMFVEACREARESGDLSTASLDYLLASTEYESFVRLAQDFALMNAWVPEDGADDTFGALEGGLED